MRFDHPLVLVTNDDDWIRESLPDLLKSFGVGAETFTSAEKFLTSKIAAQ